MSCNRPCSRTSKACFLLFPISQCYVSMIPDYASMTQSRPGCVKASVESPRGSVDSPEGTVFPHCPKYFRQKLRLTKIGKLPPHTASEDIVRANTSP